MKSNRQAVNKGTLGLLLTLASFAGAVETSLYKPYPPVCRKYDDCVPKPWECDKTSYRPIPCDRYHIMGSLEEDGKGVAKALENQDFGKAAQNLDALFEARESNAVASDSYAAVSVPEGSRSSPQQVIYSDKGSLAGGTSGDFASAEVPAPAPDADPILQKDQPGLAAWVKDVIIGIGGSIIVDGIKQGVEKIEKYVDRDQTQESIDKHGGCRMKKTC